MPRWLKIALLVLLALFAIVFAYFLRAVFMPLIVALILAYIANPLLTALERRGVHRRISIAGIFTVLAAGLALIIFWAVPAGIAQGREFVEETFTGDNPKIQKVKLWGETRIKDWLGESWDEALKNLREQVRGHEGELAKTGGKVVGAVVSFMTRSISSFLAALSFIVLVPVYLFFLLDNMNPWWEKVKAAIPEAYRERTLATLGKMHRANASFFRGQLTISLIEGAIVFIGLWIFGVRFSFLFGALYAVLSLVPFLGVVTGFTLTQLFVLADTGTFGTTFFLVAGLFALIQVLEGVVLQPLILGKETGLHPIAIILALLIFGNLFGIFGMLISVPLASAVKIVLEDYIAPMFREVTANAPTPPARDA